VTHCVTYTSHTQSYSTSFTKAIPLLLTEESATSQETPQCPTQMTGAACYRKSKCSTQVFNRQEACLLSTNTKTWSQRRPIWLNKYSQCDVWGTHSGIT